MSIVYVLTFVFIAGVCTASPVSRIVDGTPTTIEEHPGIVQIEAFDTPNIWSQHCGGNILNELYILSAAHCTERRWDPLYRPWHRRIRAGTTYRSNGGVIRNVASILNHPGFLGPTSFVDNDICIIRLTEVLPFGDGIRSISIPPQGYVMPDYVSVKQVGWGTIGEYLPPSEELLYVDLLNVRNCDLLPGMSDWLYLLTDNMVCAAPGPEIIAGACHGDSGGPLYYGGVLIGLVSWMPGGDCLNTLPTINTRVASHTNWILDNTP